MPVRLTSWYNGIVDERARQRAARRRQRAEEWPVRRYALGHEPPLDPLDSTTVDERLALMWPLAIEMWELSGREVPDYRRDEAPGNLRRPGQDRM